MIWVNVRTSEASYIQEVVVVSVVYEYVVYLVMFQTIRRRPRDFINSFFQKAWAGNHHILACSEVNYSTFIVISIITETLFTFSRFLRALLSTIICLGFRQLISFFNSLRVATLIDDMSSRMSTESLCILSSTLSQFEELLRQDILQA